MKRNYAKSIVLHTVILLLLLLFPFLNESPKAETYENVIHVNFSRSETETAMATPKGGASKAGAPKAAPKAPAKPTEKKTAVPEIQSKVHDNENLQLSPEPVVEKHRKVEVKEEPKKIVPPAPPKPTAEELEAARKKEAREAKKSKLSDLLSKSTKKESPADLGSGDGDESGPGDSNIDANGSDSKGTIRGVLGNRKVLKIPSITDSSQKKGRVVVKICVNASGDVVSSEYTMMGSTTSDTYLIGLAETGAKDYKFSPSSNPKECGRVTIEFLLK